MLELFDQHISKINKIINSCITVEHIESAKQVIKNFIDYWKTKKINIKTLRHYLHHFNTLIHFKLRLINYNE
jgi:DNA-directed RNA polymerase